MAFTTELPLSNLVDLCRVLRHTLGAGLSIVEVFRQQARSGLPSVRPVAERICKDLERGASLEEALKHQEGLFPPLFLAMTTVAEQSGNLPEVLGELEGYYQLQQRLRRQFLTGCIKPAVQYILAVCIIACLIWLLGLIADNRGGRPVDPLGVGLVGMNGALIFLFVAAGVPAALGSLYAWARDSGKQRVDVHRFLLGVPALGPCLLALALTRFCLALRLTTEAGMLIADALGLSLKATGNAAFVQRVPQVQDSLRSGNNLTVSLAQVGLFPVEFVQVLAVAEASGQIAEVMSQRSAHYRNEAEHQLTVLTKLAAFAVWLIVAVLIAVAVIRIFVETYLAANAL
jgi:type IV pilus assembly protein PilC